MIYEALCRKCGETFNPTDEDDLIHLVRWDGDDCGGQGDMMGVWSQISGNEKSKVKEVER